MLKIHLGSEPAQAIISACERAGVRETGGMLFGEHVDDSVFRVVEVTALGLGSIANFVRGLVRELAQLERFFRKTKRDYRRFNYLGEWHSHPSFGLHPSSADDDAMFEIVNDPSTGAQFTVSIIVKLVDGRLHAEAFAYFASNKREKCLVVFSA
jgi:[CysO sulfur-carrier protein]-S-L-cysteine hydrolase